MWKQVLQRMVDQYFNIFIVYRAIAKSKILFSITVLPATVLQQYKWSVTNGQAVFLCYAMTYSTTYILVKVHIVC